MTATTPTSAERPTPAAEPAAPDAPGAARRPGYRRLPVQQRREQLIAVALELFASRPPEEVSLDDVAEAAGASRPLVYRYFAGKQQLYEAALRSAAEELAGRFTVPPDGTPTEQLASVLDSYFAFVAEHHTGYGALLRGGSVVETARTGAIVDEVRRVALRRTVRHLGVRGEAGPRLTLLVRSWISVVEASALSWLDEGGQIEPTALRDWLIDQFVVMTAATAAHDPQTAGVLAALLELDPRAVALLRRLGS
ncbi:TetR/AcrR family transcriptional regulator [Kitasatospora sp. NPDC096147]|uniref:TetR/AcrR family transcriptional regulator n=1 Tax=Kitasatospora sp. NPDC096147 TaxID=3364093 RepID=UPI0037FECCB3